MGFWKILNTSDVELDFFDDLNIIVTNSVPGAGMANVQNVVVPYGNNDGAQYQQQFVPAGIITLSCVTKTLTLDAFHTTRQAIINLTKRDRKTTRDKDIDDEPLTLRYTDGIRTLEIDCYYNSGLQFNSIDKTIEKFPLQFLAVTPFWKETSQTTTVLSTLTTTTLNYVAENSGAWDDMASGVNAPIRAVFIDGTDRYIFGDATNMGGVGAADYGAKFNGTVYSALDSGPSNTINAASFVSATEIYAGGTDQKMEEWNGTTWLEMEGFIFDNFGIQPSGGAVLTIAIDGTDMYLGGDFTQINETSANKIAHIDLSTFVISSLDTGLNGTCWAIAVDSSTGDVYAGGTFTDKGSRIAKWDGSWSTLGTGLNQTCLAIAIDSSTGDVYAGGQFTSPGSRIAKWDGSWSTLGTGLNNSCRTIAIDSSTGDVYAGGDFTDKGSRIAKWDGSWSTLGTGLNGRCRTIAIDSSTGDVYAGGDFTSPNERLSIWNGLNWTGPLDGDFTNTVYDILLDASNLPHIVGIFTNVGGASNLDFYVNLYTSLEETVQVIEKIGNEIFVNSLHQGVVKHTGSGYATINFQDTGVTAIVELGTDIYIGGSFLNPGEISANRVVRYDTITKIYHELGIGLSGPVTAMDTDGTNIYVSFSGTLAGGRTVNGIAKWNVSSGTWSPMGTGIDTTAYSISAIKAVSPSEVYVTGDFPLIGGVFTPVGVAKWNGKSWSAVHTDLNGGGVNVLAIDVSGNTFVYGFDSVITSKSRTGTITLSGGVTAATSPIFKVVGTGMLDFILNDTSGKFIVFDGLTLAAQTVTVDTRPGNIEIVRDTENVIFALLRGGGSSLATFMLRPGTNDIIVFVTGASAPTATVFHTTNHWSFDGVT